MTDGTPAPGTATPEPAAVQDTATEPAVDQQKQENAEFAKLRREAAKAAKERDALAAQLAERDEANKSDQEKALAAAKAEGRKEVEALLASQALDHALERELLSQGYDPDLAHMVKAKAEISEPGDVAAAVKEVLGSKEWLKAKPVVPGTGPPDRNRQTTEFPRGAGWDIEQIREVRARGEFAKYKESILAWQRKGA